jgi:hypothetical protein
MFEAGTATERERRYIYIYRERERERERADIPSTSGLQSHRSPELIQSGRERQPLAVAPAQRVGSAVVVAVVVETGKVVVVTVVGAGAVETESVTPQQLQADL